MEIAEAHLEEWMRRHYFGTHTDIGSSGVHSYSFAQVRSMTGLEGRDLDEIVFDDSWTYGGHGVRSAVARRWTGGDDERVMVTHGSSEAIFLSMHAVLREGDQVITLDPAYPQLYAIAESIGCTLRRWRMRPENGFVPDLDELRELVGPRTSMIVVNLPHNPTGATVSREQQRELVGIAAEAGAYLVWDAAFAELTHDGPPLPDPLGWYERTITYGTLSKAYGLPGLRIGWCLAAPEVLRRCARLRDYVSLHLSPLVELVAERVVDHGDLFVAERRELARSNLALVERWAAELGDRVVWRSPGGGVCAFPGLPGVPDTEELCRRLAEEDGVLLVPGECFGHPGHVRLGFGSPAGELTHGLERLTGALNRHTAGI